MNVLFYLKNRNWGSCAEQIRANHDHFLEGLVDYNWDISFAYYANASKAKLMALENISGTPYNKNTISQGLFSKPLHDYVLSKGEYSDKKTKRLFSMTLKPAHNRPSVNLSAKRTTPNTSGTVTNPLSGLDQLLSSNVREEGHTVVLFFGNDFPYNSTQEWNEFYSKHPNVSVVVLSYRNTNVSNFVHVLEAEHDFSFVAACDDKSSFQKVLPVIQDKLN